LKKKINSNKDAKKGKLKEIMSSLLGTGRRCCSKIEDEFRPSYASVLVALDLQGTVTTLEAGQLCPCITAWCSSCQAPYLLTTSMELFPSASAHHAHMIILHGMREKREQTLIKD